MSTIGVHPRAHEFVPFDYQRWGGLEPGYGGGDAGWRQQLERLCGRLCARPASLPFRTELRRAAGSALGRGDRVAGPASGDASDAEVVRHDARFAELTAAGAEALVDHPDEQVADALLRFRSEWLRCRPEILQRFTRRLLRDALAGGVVWTPLLDQVALRGLWPDPLPAPSWDTRPGGHDRTPWGLHEPLECWLRVLAGWAYHASPVEAHALLRFQSDEVRMVAVLGARELGADSVRLVLRGMPFGHLIARNGRLGPEAASVLVDWALDLVGRGGVECPAVAAYALDYAGRRGLQVTAATLERLLAVLPAHAAHGRAVDTGEPVAWVVLQQRGLQPEGMLQLLDLFRAENEIVVQVAHHPAADLRVWRRLASTCSLPRVRRRLSEIPAAREDPAVRPVLLSSRAPEVLANLCRGASPTEFVDLVARVADRDPEAARRLLSESPEFTARVRRVLAAGGDEAASRRLAALEVRVGDDVSARSAVPSPALTGVVRDGRVEYGDVDDLITEVSPDVELTVRVTRRSGAWEVGDVVRLETVAVDLAGVLRDGREMICRVVVEDDVPYPLVQAPGSPLHARLAAAERSARDVARRLVSYVAMCGRPVRLSNPQSCDDDVATKGAWSSGELVVG